MKKYLMIIIILSVVKLLIQFFGNVNYGFHRDELLHLSVSEHLDWGYMEFSPLIGVIGKISYWLFDYSLFGVRLFPTLAGVGILILCCLTAKELGGKQKAIFLAGVCILASVPFYRNHTLFQPVAFDQLFWSLGFYFVIKYINSSNKKFLILTGVALGLGLMNKYTMLVWAFSIFIGLFFFQKGRVFKNKWLYISVLISLIIFLPNIIWQIHNEFPLLKHLKALSEQHLANINPLDFVLGQLYFLLTLLVGLLGLTVFLVDKNLKNYRIIGVSVLVIFFTMWILNSKAYYVYPIYPVLFASGAVKLETVLSKNTTLIFIVAATLLLPSIYYIPEATPLLPIEKYIWYKNLDEKNGRIELPADYADMFGWEEQVKLVDSVYQSLSTGEKNNCVIWTNNYGQAGAIKILGKKYDLPNPISRHGTFWTWGYGNKDADVWISLGNDEQSVKYVFEEVELVTIITHKYAIDEENEIPLYICRNPKIDIEKWWRDYKDHIFN